MFIWLNVMLLMTKESKEVSFIDLVSNVTLFWDSLFNHIMDRYIMTFCDSIFWLLSKNPNFIFDSWFTQICKKNCNADFRLWRTQNHKKNLLHCAKIFEYLLFFTCLIVSILLLFLILSLIKVSILHMSASESDVLSTMIYLCTMHMYLHLLSVFNHIFIIFFLKTTINIDRNQFGSVQTSQETLTFS